MRTNHLACLLVTAGLLIANRIVAGASPGAEDEHIISPTDAIARLKEGNGRYTSGNLQHPRQSSEERTQVANNSYENLGMTPAEAAKRRAELAHSQHPFAIIVGCADSRVPPEIVFDQGLGDLFVLRVAGNVIDDHSLGSIEYAVDHLAVRLIVVLGHQRCGAVQAAKETIAAKGKAPGHIQSLVAAIEPAVAATVNGDLETTVKANVEHVVQALRASTPVLKTKVESGDVSVIGGYYELDSGGVTFLGEKGPSK